MKIKATFLDEISHDIPHQNWGAKEWDADFAYMRAIGIEMVVLIRSGYKRWQTFPSEVLTKTEKCYTPLVGCQFTGYRFAVGCWVFSAAERRWLQPKIMEELILCRGLFVTSWVML